MYFPGTYVKGDALMFEEIIKDVKLSMYASMVRGIVVHYAFTLKRLVTYGDIAKSLRTLPGGGQLSQALALITEEDHRNKAPLTVSVVVNGDTKIPGEGFFVQCSELGYLTTTPAEMYPPGTWPTDFDSMSPEAVKQWLDRNAWANFWMKQLNLLGVKRKVLDTRKSQVWGKRIVAYEVDKEDLQAKVIGKCPRPKCETLASFCKHTQGNSEELKNRIVQIFKNAKREPPKVLFEADEEDSDYDPGKEDPGWTEREMLKTMIPGLTSCVKNIHGCAGSIEEAKTMVDTALADISRDLLALGWDLRLGSWVPWVDNYQVLSRQDEDNLLTAKVTLFQETDYEWSITSCNPGQASPGPDATRT
jgi:hypothetical protein